MYTTEERKIHLLKKKVNFEVEMLLLLRLLLLYLLQVCGFGAETAVFNCISTWYNTIAFPDDDNNVFSSIFEH